MEESLENVIESKKKPARSLCLRRKYIIAAVFILCIFAGFIYKAMTWEPKPDPESEKIIREAAAKQLTTDPNNPIEPNELTDEDFEQITFLLIQREELSNIKLLEKFKNLQELRLINIRFPEENIPKYMKFLAKFGFYDLNERFSIDLSPIEKLTKLQKLYINDTPIKNIKPLSDIINLEQIWLNETKVTDLEPLKNLTKLQMLSLFMTDISDLEPIKRLTNLQLLSINSTKVSDLEAIKGLTNLKYLSFSGTKVSNLESVKGLTKLQELIVASTEVTDLEPIRNLISLRALYINVTKVSDIEPVMRLSNLEELGIGGCENISKKQIEDLKKALPNLNFSLEM